jgi:hypothetical protein
MNVLFSKFFGQALGQRSDTEFASCECARDGIPSDCSGSSCEDQTTSLPSATLSAFTWLFKVVLCQFEHNFPGESKGGENIGIQRFAHFLLADFQEWLPYAISSIEHCNTEGRRRYWKMCPDVGECGTDRGRSVVRDREGYSLTTRCLVRSKTRQTQLAPLHRSD